MRNIFDKLEGISVFVRSGIILILAAILISGLLFTAIPTLLSSRHKRVLELR